MTTIKRSSKGAAVEALVVSDPDLIKALMKQALQEVLEGQMTFDPQQAATVGRILGLPGDAVVLLQVAP